MDALNILIVEDDDKVSHAISTSLREQGFGTIRCGTGEEAHARLQDSHVDLVLLDLGLPDMDGLEVLQQLRASTRTIPVLILTARDAVSDRIAGLDTGADDYLVKPFSMPELHARVRALHRRVELGRTSSLSCGDLEVDLAKRSAQRDGQSLDLSPKDFDLLWYLLEHQGEVVTRTMLAEEVWKYSSRATPIDNVIDVQMSRLRDKVDKPFDQRLIHTVRGVGFTMGESA